VPYLRELGFFAAIFFVLGAAYVLWRWRRGHNATLLLALGVMLLPTVLSVAFPHEVPNAVRAIGALPAAMLLPAVGVAALWRGLAAQFPPREPREINLDFRVDEDQTLSLRWRWGWTGRHSMALLLAVILVLETRTVYPVYFEQYVAHLPSQNYAISREIAAAIDEFADDGESFSKVWPYWYDGNAVRAQLRREDQSWHNELDQLRPDQPPLAGAPGKFMVIVHPDDVDALQTLRAAFPRGIALEHTDFAGRVAFITFYGER
jgi:hypothetical protein